MSALPDSEENYKPYLIPLDLLNVSTEKELIQKGIVGLWLDNPQHKLFYHQLSSDVLSAFIETMQAIPIQFRMDFWYQGMDEATTYIIKVFFNEQSFIDQLNTLSRLRTNADMVTPNDAIMDAFTTTLTALRPFQRKSYWYNGMLQIVEDIEREAQGPNLDIVQHQKQHLIALLDPDNFDFESHRSR